jgi:hypothetical protein
MPIVARNLAGITGWTPIGWRCIYMQVVNVATVRFVKPAPTVAIVCVVSCRVRPQDWVPVHVGITRQPQRVTGHLCVRACELTKYRVVVPRTVVVQAARRVLALAREAVARRHRARAVPHAAVG